MDGTVNDGFDGDVPERTLERFRALGATDGDGDGRAGAGAAGSRTQRQATAQAHKFGFERLDGLRVNRSCNWLIKGVMPARGVMVMYGAPGSGKSFLALDAALHVSCGKDWFGHRTREPAGVVYVAAEGGAGFRHRAVAARDHLGAGAETPFALITAAPDLGCRRASDLQTLTKDVTKQAAAAGFRPALIVFDTLSRCIGNLDESSSQDMNHLVRRLSALSDGLGACVLVVHHSGKDPGRGLRGSSTLQGAADAIWLVARDADTGSRTFSLEKVKDGADRVSAEFVLDAVDLGPDEDGDPIASCVVRRGDRPDAVPAAPEAPQADARARTVVRAVAAVCDEEGRDAPAGGTAPSGGRVADVANLRKLLRASGLAGGASTADSARMIVGKAIKAAEDLGWIGRSRDDGLVWLTDAGRAVVASVPGPKDRLGGAGAA